eukprot:COSAG04_NODE_3042_length_3244_cov_6.312242_2_plen_143_part_00
MRHNLPALPAFLLRFQTGVLPCRVGLPPLVDEAGCMCCSVSTGPDAVRGRPLHSSQLYDERLGVWIPAQGLKLGRQNLGACSVGSGVVALGGMVAGKVVSSCEQLRLPDEVGGEEALALLLGQAEWTPMPDLPVSLSPKLAK